MKKIILIILTIIISINGCSYSKEENSKRGIKKEKIIVSIPVYKNFVSEIGGKNIEVISIIKDNENPEKIDISGIKTKEISSASIYFFSSLFPFEKEIAIKLKDKNPKIKIINLDISKEYPEIDKKNFPWLSPNILIKQVEKITEAFTNKNPKKGVTYLKNEEKTNNKINEMTLKISTSLYNSNKNKALDLEGVWGYFIYSYNFKEIKIAEEKRKELLENKDKLIEFIKKENINIIFIPEKYKKIENKIEKSTNANIIFAKTLSQNYLDEIKNF